MTLRLRGTVKARAATPADTPFVATALLRPLICLPLSLCATYLDPSRFGLTNKGLLHHHREICLFPWQREDRPSGTCHYENLKGTLNGTAYLSYDTSSCGDVVRATWQLIGVAGHN